MVFYGLRYMGHDAYLSQATLRRLTNDLAGPREYGSGLWHHDACGKRLKLMLRLHDVPDNAKDRATWVVRGSQGMMYLSQQHTRLSGSYVQRAFGDRVEPLLGIVIHYVMT